MNRLLLALGLGALCATGLGAAQTNPPAAQPKSAEQLRYEQEVRDVEASRLRYEAAQRQHQADLVRYRRELEQAERAQRRYERRRASYDARQARRRESEQEPESARSEPVAAQQPIAATSERCEQQSRRNRGRGRAIGGILGGVAGGALGRGGAAGRIATAALSAPVGALIGDVIARLLDCREQEQAAAATEHAVERGIGTTTNWTSESRPNVTGSSTVTAAATPMPDGNPCVTVTDIVIIDGEETRAPKTMCRRPPTNRYVRV